ncbi:glutamine--fructose-6-phosphate transaminase (isomerizing) [Candidatus Woesebacteria bacterium]|nr:glutamine--fructose-6-phosphate transaminase (isomerizing) [Candidatus Woesebacteria bacterium]
MCGIFGYVGYKKNAVKIVFTGLKDLEYRGYDSWGVAVVPENNEARLVVKKKAGKIGNSSIDELPQGRLALGHTRWATHGGVTDSNAHPHLDCTGSIALVHNGIFENYESIKKELLKKGHKFISETDTEVAVHLVEEYAKTMTFDEAVRSAFNKMDGLNAIIVIWIKDHELVVARNGSPLIVGFGKKENFVASDAAALIPHTKIVHFLEDGEMAIIRDDRVSIFHAKNGKTIQPIKRKLSWSIAQAEKGSYPYFMLKEINEQPKIIRNIASAFSQAEKLAKVIKRFRNVYLMGCGSASYVSLAGSYLFSQIAKYPINWAIGSEFWHQLRFLTKNDLVIALSQSGETMDTLEPIKKAKAQGAKIFAIVNVLGSTLYREANYKMLIGAGPEKSVASTKAVTGKLAHLIALSYALAGKSKEGKALLMEAAKSGEVVLESKSITRIKSLAVRLKNTRHIYIVGRGLSYPAGLETAMKLKEISYVHAEGMAAGELKHGPLALVEKGTPCIVFMPNDELYSANLASAMEMKARGGMIIGVSHKTHDIFDYYLPVADVREATIIPNIITGQILAYYLTILRGLDPDKPRNLAKSVTVK